LLPQGPFQCLVPDAADVNQKVTSGQTRDDFPYWARLWPSSVALSAFLQNNKQLVIQKRVAELAAGIGLPSLVAATYAKSVWCSDISTEAMEVAAQSVSLHNLNNIRFEACNWMDLPPDFDWDVVLLSDVNYDPANFRELETVLISLLHKRCTLILATPQRLMAKPFIEKLIPFVAQQETTEVNHGNAPVPISIFVLQKV
jgi:predicted nicotinamide N-methyase